MKKIIAILLMLFICAIPLTVCAEEENEPTIYDIAKADVFIHEGTTLPYRYVLPEDYNPEQTYPLILFLLLFLKICNMHCSIAHTSYQVKRYIICQLSPAILNCLATASS